MTTTYTSYKLISSDLPTSLKRVSEQPDVKRETEYYLYKIGSIKSIDEFFADSRLYNYAMKAHGLDDMAYAKAFMRKVLTEGIDDKAAFANQLSDTRYKELAESLNFARHGELATTFERAQKGVVDKYTRHGPRRSTTPWRPSTPPGPATAPASTPCSPIWSSAPPPCPPT